jgi:hypothetical protein
MVSDNRTPRRLSGADYRPQKPGVIALACLALIAATIFSACSDPSLDQSFAQAQALDAEWQGSHAQGEDRLRTRVKEERDAAHRGILPANYKQQIDAGFVNTLIDPDFREIEYMGHPYGGLVCGYVNAKDRTDGYIGRNPFYALFSADGKLTRLNSYTIEEVAADQTRDMGALSDCQFRIQ